jgi:general nucleoside transport system permease protein
MTTVVAPPVGPESSTGLAAAIRSASPTRLYLALGIAMFALLSLVRVLTDADGLTSSATMGTTLRLTVPILLAALGALFAERAGIVNIGVEGMMILGTWFGGWAAWQWGAWAGLVIGILGGSLGGLIHGVAVIRFNVDHVISGVAINIFAFGITRYLSELVFTGQQGGGISQSPQQSSSIPKVNIPFLAGGEIFGWQSPDMLGWFEEKGWFFISDLAGIARGLTYNVSWASLIALAMVPLSAWVLWRTRFGLRLRSSGEAPAAAESLGVRISRLRYAAMAISGGFAGFAGAFLAIVLSNYYRQGQTANRGFIGIAVMIFGNWNPWGILGGAMLFGFADALQLVGRDALPKLFLFLSIVMAILAVFSFVRRKVVAGTVATVAAIGFLIVFLTVEEIPEPLTKSAPYVLTLIVLAAASQRLRPPAHAGKPYRSGEDH